MIRKTPGVYIQRVQSQPIDPNQLETALPVFFGYAERIINEAGESILFKPQPIRSLTDYEAIFGGAYAPQKFDIHMDLNKDLKIEKVVPERRYFLYESIRHFYDNGGETCWVVAIGSYPSNEHSDQKGNVKYADFKSGLDALRKWDEPTLLLCPDAVAIRDVIDQSDLRIYQDMLKQSADLQDRFAIIDIPEGDLEISDQRQPIEDFRNRIGVQHLEYGAVYYPWLYTDYAFKLTVRQLSLIDKEKNEVPKRLLSVTAFESSLLNKANQLNHKIDGFLKELERDELSEAEKLVIKKQLLNTRAALSDAEAGLFHEHQFFRNVYEAVRREMSKIPPSAAMAGIYTATDRERGVWKAPANIKVQHVNDPVISIDEQEQEELNVHHTGKSVNAIRNLPARGTIVWGARTLAGNSLEWRYIPVRRLFIYVEESIKKALEPFVFESNNAHTWVEVQAKVENFLNHLWRQGALNGATPEQAYFVAVGEGKTMTSVDALEGRMIVEIGLAAVRPLEFITLKFECKLE